MTMQNGAAINFLLNTSARNRSTHETAKKSLCNHRNSAEGVDEHIESSKMIIGIHGVTPDDREKSERQMTRLISINV